MKAITLFAWFVYILCFATIASAEKETHTIKIHVSVMSPMDTTTDCTGEEMPPECILIPVEELNDEDYEPYTAAEVAAWREIETAGGE